MSRFLFVIAGASSAAVFTALVGYLSLRIRAAELGARLDPLTNEVVFVVGPHVPVAALVVTAVAGALTACGLVLSAVRLPLQWALGFGIGYGAATIALIICAYALSGFAPIGAQPDRQPLGTGWEGWLIEAGSDALVWTMGVLGLGAMLLRPAVVRSRSMANAAHAEG